MVVGSGWLCRVQGWLKVIKQFIRKRTRNQYADAIGLRQVKKRLFWHMVCVCARILCSHDCSAYCLRLAALLRALHMCYPCVILGLPKCFVCV